jgi:ABC-type Fe3+ transport system permease subunit
LLEPLFELARAPQGWSAWAEPSRIGGLFLNTLGLAAGAVLLAVPVGALAAVVLERLRPPGAPVIRAAVAVGLFVPLPVYAVAWQTVLGNWLPPLALQPGQIAWRPWGQGLLPAAWVHGAAALPWVIWIVAAGLRQTDRSLEDEAAVDGGPWAVIRLVVLPRLALAVAAAAAWVVVQAAAEIPVTDAMMVRTFAEEVYTQLVGEPSGVAAAVAVTVPVWLTAVAVASVLAARLVGRYGTPSPDTGPIPPLRVGVALRVFAAAAVWLVAGVFAGLPLGALLWKAGGGGSGAGWASATLATELRVITRLHGQTLLIGVAAAAATGAATAGLALVACRAAERSKWFTGFLFVLTIAAWLTPGPLVGMALKEVINRLVAAEAAVLARTGLSPPFPPVSSALYDQPSPLPSAWAAAIRFFPLAVAVCWPAVRAVPRELTEAAALDGAEALGEWGLVTWPLTRAAFARAAVAVGVLALGEMSAGKLVAPPHYRAYILELFNQMHYGSEATVAAFCLIQVAVTAAAVGLAFRVLEPGRRVTW